jgi:membrane protein
MRDNVAAFQQSPAARFTKKLGEDRVGDLAALLAWGTLNTLFPLLLGLLAVAGLVLRDPQTLDAVRSKVLEAFPQDVAGIVGKVLQDTLSGAAVLGIVGVALLVWNGSGFFVRMQSVFNRVYHVPDRGFVGQRVVGLAMLIIAAALLMFSAISYGAASVLVSASDLVLQYIPFQVPGRGLLGGFIGWSLSIVSAVLLFLVLYKFLPNKPRPWTLSMPGALAASVLYFVIMQVFPLYMAFFGKGFQTYAIFGIVLLMMFWSYLLGLVLVLGAELNAFLEGPELAVQPLPAEVGLTLRGEQQTPKARGFKDKLVGLAGIALAVLLVRRRQAGEMG